MNLNDIFNFLNFYINKFTGGWYTIPELEDLVDFGQMALYSDLKPKFATSQLLKEELIPFKEVYNFTTLLSGYIIVPATNYLDLLDIQIYFQISDRTIYYGVDLANEDTRPARLNSQIDPPTTTSPVGEQTAPRTFRLYPAAAYNGNVTYLRRPVKPVFGYNTISGRIIVYDSATSTQLEWRETEIPIILIKALNSIGINIGSQEVQQWAQVKEQANYLNMGRQ